jgi:hypothetical protein
MYTSAIRDSRPGTLDLRTSPAKVRPLQRHLGRPSVIVRMALGLAPSKVRVPQGFGGLIRGSAVQVCPGPPHHDGPPDSDTLRGADSLGSPARPGPRTRVRGLTRTTPHGLTRPAPAALAAFSAAGAGRVGAGPAGASLEAARTSDRSESSEPRAFAKPVQAHFTLEDGAASDAPSPLPGMADSRPGGGGISDVLPAGPPDSTPSQRSGLSFQIHERRPSSWRAPYPTGARGERHSSSGECPGPVAATTPYPLVVADPGQRGARRAA